MRFRTKLMLGFSSLLVLTGVAFLIIFLGFYQKKMIEGVENHRSSLAIHFCSELTDMVLTEDTLQLKDTINNFCKDITYIDYVFVIGNDGRLLTHTFEQGFPTEFFNVNPLPTDKTITSKLLRTKKGRIRDFAIRIARHMPGEIHVGMNEEVFYKQINDTAKTTIFFMVVCLVLGLLLIYVISLYLTKPLKNLSLGMEKIGKGDLDFRLEEKGDYEVLNLVQGYNRMAGSIQEATTKLQQAKERIEHLNAVLRAIRKVNQLIVKVKDRGNLLQGICESFIETRGYYSSWIVFIEEDGRLITASHAGVGEGFQTMIDKMKSGQMTQCIRQASEQPGVVVVANPAVECGDCPLVGTYAGNARLIARLEYEGRVYGFLTVTIPVEMAQDEQERMLLCEVADDIAFALNTIEVEAERKLAEEALKESQRYTRGIIEASLDALVTISAEGKITDVNHATELITGMSRNEIIGTDFSSYFTDPDAARKGYQQVYRDNYLQNYPLEIKHRDGKVTPVLYNASVYKDAQGRIAGVFVAARDITKLKQAEEEKKKLEAQFQQAQKMEAIGRLAGGVAHDFNNILTIIIGNADLLSISLGKDNPLQGRVEEISKGGERAAALTRQLLAFSRRQMLEPQVLDLNGVIPNMDKMLRRLIGEDIDLKTVLAPELGRVEADPGQIEQVIMNLAVNARDAMPTGGKLTIETANVDLDETYAGKHVAVKPGPYVMMAISDTGTGMDEETRSNIFEPFFTTKEKGRGTGLGLSTVYGIVKQSGGNIWVYSEPEKGTTFKIYLPRVEKVAETAEKVKATAESLTGSETIMVVEDDKMVRDMARSILQQYGYSILDAQDGKEAIRVSEQYEGPIHLMLTDVVMPGMSGRVLAEQLAVQRPKMKVLYMSGYTDNAIVHHGVLDKGMILIQKPFTPESLAKKVREVLNK